MSRHSWSPYAHEGRIVGSFVYLLLCRDENKIYIKIGHSIQPEKRFLALRNGCPVTPRSFCVIHVPSQPLACKLEVNLHKVFDQWRVAGEWFAMTAADKETFNFILHTALEKESMPLWPLRLQKIPATTLIRLAEQRKNFWRARYRKGGKAYRDFVKHTA